MKEWASFLLFCTILLDDGLYTLFFEFKATSLIDDFFTWMFLRKAQKAPLPCKANKLPDSMPSICFKEYAVQDLFARIPFYW